MFLLPSAPFRCAGRTNLREDFQVTLTFITGGSRGLGLETAKALKAAGHSIVLVAKDGDRLKAAASELQCEYRAVDLEDLAVTKRVFNEMLETFGVPET